MSKKRTNKRTETHACDLISRQAAVDAICKACANGDNYVNCRDRDIKSRWCDNITALRDLPSAQPDLITTIQNGIKATDADDVYSCGMRNGMRWCISLIDDKEPLYENCPSAQPETAKRIVGKSRDGMTLWYQCDMCNEPVDVQDNYCRGCGRRLIDE